MRVALFPGAGHSDFVIGRTDADLQMRLRDRLDGLHLPRRAGEKPHESRSSSDTRCRIRILEAPAQVSWRPGRELSEALFLQPSALILPNSEGLSLGPVGFVATSRHDLRVLLDRFLARFDLRLPGRFTIPDLVSLLNLEPGFRVCHAGPETRFPSRHRIFQDRQGIPESAAGMSEMAF